MTRGSRIARRLAFVGAATKPSEGSPRDVLTCASTRLGADARDAPLGGRRSDRDAGGAAGGFESLTPCRSVARTSRSASGASARITHALHPRGDESRGESRGDRVADGDGDEMDGDAVARLRRRASGTAGRVEAPARNARTEAGGAAPSVRSPSCSRAKMEVGIQGPSLRRRRAMGARARSFAGETRSSPARSSPTRAKKTNHRLAARASRAAASARAAARRSAATRAAVMARASARARPARDSARVIVARTRASTREATDSASRSASASISRRRTSNAARALFRVSTRARATRETRSSRSRSSRSRRADQSAPSRADARADARLASSEATRDSRDSSSSPDSELSNPENRRANAASASTRSCVASAFLAASAARMSKSARERWYPSWSRTKSHARDSNNARFVASSSKQRSSW